jgi:hypothetical protein
MLTCILLDNKDTNSSYYHQWFVIIRSFVTKHIFRQCIYSTAFKNINSVITIHQHANKF